MQDRFKFRHFNKLVKKMTYYDNPEMQVCLNGDFKSGIIFPMSEEIEGNAMYMGNYENLQQCTGLKDKNGKLIYEGDIVKGTCGVYWGLMVVEHLDNRASFIYRRLDDKYYPLPMLGECNFEEVIGNIYENPELLKDGEE